RWGRAARDRTIEGVIHITLMIVNQSPWWCVKDGRAAGGENRREIRLGEKILPQKSRSERIFKS
ncbi:MAG: hypothetical protein ACTH3G_06145, partial [Citricoccus sp.]